MTVSIRPYAAQDWPQLWGILNATFARGETYAFPTDWSESETVRISLSICRMTFATRFSLWIRPARRSTTKKIAIPTSGTNWPLM